MIAVASIRSGGATTLALALAARLGAVLVEADPAGGVLALRHGLGREPGLGTLAATRTVPDLADHAQRLPGGVAAVVAPESPERAAQLLTVAADRLVAAVSVADPPPVVDLGRLLPASPAKYLARAAAPLLVVARPVAEELVPAAEILAGAGEAAALVLCGPGPYRAADVVDQLGCGVVATLPDDLRSARALAAGAALPSRSPLGRAVASLAEQLVRHDDDHDDDDHDEAPAPGGRLAPLGA